jgi:hypothetical protein
MTLNVDDTCIFLVYKFKELPLWDKVMLNGSLQFRLYTNCNILEVLIPCQSNADLMFGGITIICGVFGTLAGGLVLDKMTSTISNAFKVQLSISILIVKLHEFSYIFMYHSLFYFFSFSRLQLFLGLYFVSAHFASEVFMGLFLSSPLESC